MSDGEFLALRNEKLWYQWFSLWWLFAIKLWNVVKNNLEIFLSLSVKPIFLGKFHNLYDMEEIEKAWTTTGFDW